MRKPDFGYAKKMAKLISAFVFATQIVQFLYFINPKFLVPGIFCGCKPDLCWTRSETSRTGFLTTRLNFQKELLFLRDYFIHVHRLFGYEQQQISNHNLR